MAAAAMAAEQGWQDDTVTLYFYHYHQITIQYTKSYNQHLSTIVDINLNGNNKQTLILQSSCYVS